MDRKNIFEPISGFELPRFAGLPTFMRLPHIGLDNSKISDVDVGIIGAPWDAGTTNRPGPRHGPRQIRDLSTMIRPQHGVTNFRPFEHKNCADLGDVPPNPANLEDTLKRFEDFYSKNKKLPFSRIPKYSKNKEEINYYVLKDTILEYVIQKNGKKKLSDIKRPIIKIGYESKITVLFDKLLKKREHISLVIDEFGAVRGIVTLEDIIETLLGLEIVDETDTVVDLQVLAKKRRKQYLKDVD